MDGSQYDPAVMFPGSSDLKKREALARQNKPTHVTSYGVRFATDMPVLKPRVRRALADEVYELNETRAALAVVKPGERVVELGAGLGYMSSVIAWNCRPSAVHAFEANPDLIPCIRRVHAENDLSDVRVHHALLGEAAGEAPFYIRRNFVASSLSPEPSQGVVRVERVPVLPARETIRDLAPDVLICDIEGAELHVLPLLDLSGLRAAIVELHPQIIGHRGVGAIFDLFHGAGLIYHAKRSCAKVVSFVRPA
jgi:FkbM family methyltransferase